MHRGHAARRGELQPGPHRVDVDVVGDDEVAFLEPPRRLLAQDSRRFALRVPLDHAALDLEIAAGQRERRRVEPERVVVLRDHRRGRLAGHLVELGRRWVGAAGPVAAPPPVPADHPPALARRAGDPGKRLLERPAAVEGNLRLRERPGGEVHVRIGEPGHDHAAAEIDDLRRGKRRLVHAHATRDPVTGDRERALGRDLRIHRANEAVFEDHEVNLDSGTCRMIR